ncbi:hypothetical protein [Actinomadura sp. 7K507]|uniref:hypothetical protein n=1 Tax=Actinomadura sp. 7K507 TaxID=2530365 RepID=UPI001A9E405B|nr:hypothetical protein [Actinomadura sp. 7K507]
MTETSTKSTTEPPAAGTAGSGAVETRADRFVRQMAELRIPDPSAGRARLWLRSGVVLMVAGLVAGVAAYLLSMSTTDALRQRDALAMGLGGICACIVGSALYVRYTLTDVLRFWFARLTLSVEAPPESGEAATAEQPRQDED